MNWDVIKGNWRKVRGKAREEWGEFTDNEWDQIAGNYDQFVGRIQERYGLNRDEADRRATAWADKVGTEFDRHKE